MNSRQALSRGAATIRVEGEIVHRDGGMVAVRRGGSVFEVESGDVVAERQLENGAVELRVKADAQLIRSTVVATRWLGGAVGWLPVFDDCTECCDCTECSVCTDCTECSVCTDCAEGIGIFRNIAALAALSSWVRLLSGGAAGALGAASIASRRARRGH
jgi:hypothetical protein